MGTRGSLFFHFDLWVQPWALLPGQSSVESVAMREALLRLVWAAPEGRIMQKQSGPTKLLPLTCFNASRRAEYRGPYPAWTWDRDLPSVLDATADAARHGHKEMTSERMCIGWADLYYVPEHLQHQFSQLAAIYSRHAANAELVVPTILDAIARSLHRTTSQALSTLRLHAKSSNREMRYWMPLLHMERSSAGETVIMRPRCWGFCCSSTICPELLLRHPCGHRMQLEEPNVRHFFDALWGGR